jgi:hypothetical protein
MLAGDIQEHSYSNFHQDGFDYLCLARNEYYTKKVYFFDEATKLDQVVAPHNHRYSFTSTVLQGSLTNIIYQYNEDLDTTWYDQYDFYTPLNGGKGFVRNGARGLKQTTAHNYIAGQTHWMYWFQVHTISVEKDTILLLTQFKDMMRKEIPSQTYALPHQTPEIPADAYQKMSMKRVLERSQQLDDLGFKY